MHDKYLHYIDLYIYVCLYLYHNEHKINNRIHFAYKQFSLILDVFIVNSDIYMYLYILNVIDKNYA